MVDSGGALTHHEIVAQRGGVLACTGWGYKNKTGNTDGITAVSLKAGTPGKPKVQVKSLRRIPATADTHQRASVLRSRPGGDRATVQQQPDELLVEHVRRIEHEGQ